MPAPAPQPDGPRPTDARGALLSVQTSRRREKSQCRVRHRGAGRLGFSALRNFALGIRTKWDRLPCTTISSGLGPRVDHVLGSYPPGEAPEHTPSATLLPCGYFQFDMLAMHPLVESFPFKALVEQTMFEYLTGLRMERSQELLRTSGLPLHEVVRRAGYESDLAFTRAFKRWLGITPTMYRKTAKADSDRASQHTTATQIESVGRRLRACTVKLTAGS